MYVLFEGVDTCGKTTQLELIEQRYPEIIVTKEPGGTPFGKKAREILLHDRLASPRAELLLFLADRAEHYTAIVEPNRNKLVLSDRGFVSGIAYALANESFDFDTLARFNAFALGGRLPDMVILFQTDLQTLKARMTDKTLDGIEQRGLEYLLTVQQHMQETILRLGIPHLFVDATETIETIHNHIMTYLRSA
jgi:dTMP kinase